MWRWRRVITRWVQSVINMSVLLGWSQRGIFIGQLGCRFTLSKQLLTAPWIMLSTRSWVIMIYNYFYTESIPDWHMSPAFSTVTPSVLLPSWCGLWPFVPSMPPPVTSAGSSLCPRSWLRHPAKRVIGNDGEVIKLFRRTLDASWSIVEEISWDLRLISPTVCNQST
jgi:hypothetical protein